MNNNANNALKKRISALAVIAAKRMFSIITELESDSDEEEEQDVVQAARQRIQRNESFIEHVLNGSTAQQFQLYFRLPLMTFTVLLPKINRCIQKDHVVGRNRMSTTKQLLATLWILATQDSYSSIGDKFDMGKSSLATSFQRCVQALNCIASTIIKWPSEQEMAEIAERMYNIAGVDNVVGVIDSTLIQIRAPSKNPEEYVTTKGGHAISLQAVCVDNLKFTDCFAGYPSSVSDMRVFKSSDLYAKVSENQDTFFYDLDYFLIGDKAYPKLDWCIPPYEFGNLSDAQQHFNLCILETGKIIGRAFALLFGRFRRLQHIDMNRTDLIPSTVLAACVLHNLCLDHKDLLIDEYINEGQNSVIGNDHLSDYDFFNDDEDGKGSLKRDELCRDLYELQT